MGGLVIIPPAPPAPIVVPDGLAPGQRVRFFQDHFEYYEELVAYDSVRGTATVRILGVLRIIPASIITEAVVPSQPIGWDVANAVWGVCNPISG